MRFPIINAVATFIIWSVLINHTVTSSKPSKISSKKFLNRHNNKSNNRHKSFDPNNITAFETARSQLSSLFDKNVGTMNRRERIFRIGISWILLLTAKIIALASPLYFKKIIESGNQPEEKINFLHAIDLSIPHLILSLGFLKLISGFVQLVSEFILAPTLSDAAETLPNEVFSVALKMAGNRGKPKSMSNSTACISSTTSSSLASLVGSSSSSSSFTNAISKASNIQSTSSPSPKTVTVYTSFLGTKQPNRKEIPKSVIQNIQTPSSSSSSSSITDTNITPGKAFYSHLLDRGIKASSLFLYRTVYNLLPTIVESITIFIFICSKVSYQVGLTVGLISIIYVTITTMIMSLRIPTQRQHLNNEKVANGFAEDALTLAETIAVFGTQKVEEQRYASALRQVSQTGLWFRQSFSILKFAQCVILAIGAAVVTFSTYHSHTSSSSSSSSSLVGKLVLSSSLFAQICMPLDYVGQHIRDCITSAEDLRELDVIRRSLRHNNYDDDDCRASYTYNEHERNNKGRNHTDNNKSSNNNNNINMNTYQGTKVDEKGFFGIDTYTSASALCSASLDRNCRLSVRNLSFHVPAQLSSSPSSSSFNNDMINNNNNNNNLPKLLVSQKQQQQQQQQSSSSSSSNVRALLTNITFSVPSGGYTVALVGPSGSGKSTLLKVLVGINRLQIPRSLPKALSNSVNNSGINSENSTNMLKLINGTINSSLTKKDDDEKDNDEDDSPSSSSSSSSLAVNTGGVDSGEIFIDGYDMTRASVTDRALHFAMVCQDNELFRGLRLGGNIRYGTHHISHTASPDSIAAKVAFENAIDDSFLRPVVNKLGLESEVGPMGRFLSGGERQRVCIARALYREELLNRCILLMDEITSSLDASAERGVIEAIRKRVKSRGTTAIFVAHRLASIQQCDLILVLREGGVVERGTHKELIRNKKGWYSQAWAMQQQQQQQDKSGG